MAGNRSSFGTSCAQEEAPNLFNSLTYHGQSRLFQHLLPSYLEHAVPGPFSNSRKSNPYRYIVQVYCVVPGWISSSIKVGKRLEKSHH